MGRDNLWLLSVAAVLLVVIGLALSLIPSPGERRALRLNDMRMEHLRGLLWSADCNVDEAKALPASGPVTPQEVAAACGGVLEPDWLTDRLTGVAVTLRMQDQRLQACAAFDADVAPFHTYAAEPDVFDAATGCLRLSDHGADERPNQFMIAPKQ